MSADRLLGRVVLPAMLAMTGAIAGSGTTAQRPAPAATRQMNSAAQGRCRAKPTKGGTSMNSDSRSIVLRSAHIMRVQIESANRGAPQPTDSPAMSRVPVVLSVRLREVLKGPTQQQPGSLLQVAVAQYERRISRMFALPGACRARTSARVPNSSPFVATAAVMPSFSYRTRRWRSLCPPPTTTLQMSADPCGGGGAYSPAPTHRICQHNSWTDRACVRRVFGG